MISKAGSAAFDSSDFQLSFGPAYTNIIGSGPIDGFISYNGSSWVYTGSLYNVPTLKFTGGYLTVTHPSCDPINISVTAYDGSYRAQPKNLSATSFDIGFYTSAGAAVTTPDTSMKFFFSRNGYARRDNLRGTVCVRRGYAPINASKLISPSGNFWVIALHEYTD